jgi:hypothetical protein
MASIKQITGALSDKSDAKELRKLLENVLADNTAIRAALVAVTAKLDADATVTDTNYAATCNPAALTLTA